MMFWALIPIPSRARAVTIYDGMLPEGVIVPPSVYRLLVAAMFIEGDDPSVTTPDGFGIATLYNGEVIREFPIPTNATHLLIFAQSGSVEDPEPAKMNVTWTLEL